MCGCVDTRRGMCVKSIDTFFIFLLNFENEGGMCEGGVSSVDSDLSGLS